VVLSGTAWAWQAGAFDIPTGSDVKIHWDTTLRLSTALRVQTRSTKLVTDINADDGDRDFLPGIISARGDILSELDVTYRFIGGRLSGSGWYDLIYNLSNANDSPATVNAYSVPYDHFTNATRNLHGRYAQLLDAFVFVRDVADIPASVRVGRHALLWGESLFMADNGISYAQAPFDAIKALSIPGTQAKEIFLPVWQAWAQVRPLSGLSLEAFYQFEWRKTRTPAVGSYFSPVDVLDVGGERLFVEGPPGAALFRGDDLDARNSGQWGISVRYRAERIDTEFGLYYINFHDKFSQLYLLPGAVVDPAIGEVGQYILVFPEDIKLLGSSFSTKAGPVSLAGEAHVRFNMPLASIPAVVMPGVVANNDENPLYATGTTLHSQVSAIHVLRPGALWQGGTLLMEVGGQLYTAITKNPQAFNPERTRAALAFQLLFTPTYFQVLPHLDLNVPIGLAYSPLGKAPILTFNGGAAHGGVFSIGLSGEYEKAWTASILLSRFFGPPELQPFADRSNLAFALQRTF
jgi:hypothetical protein